MRTEQREAIASSRVLAWAARFALASLVAFALTGCEEAAPPTPEDPVVASGNGVEVRQAAFAAEYQQFASLAPVSDGLAARRDYARLMLERAYIAALAESTGLADQPEVQAHVERRRAFAMRQAFLTDSLEAQIEEPTEADVREAFRRQNTRVRVRQAFAPTEAAARQLEARLQAGEPFEEVARSSFEAIGLEATGEMGWVTFNDLDEAPENAVFGLAQGEVSAAVPSLRGWHVFQVLDREETVRLDGTAYAAARERLAFDVRHRRIEEAGARTLRPMLEAHELAVRLAPLRALWAQIAPLVPDRGDAATLAEARVVLPSLQLETLTRATPVATVDGAPFTVGQLLDQLPEVPVAYWTPDLRKAVEVAVRDSIVTARAEAAGTADAPEVAQEAATARRTALYYAGLRAAADTLELATHAERFYRQWRDSFAADRTTTYRAWTFETRAAAASALELAMGDAGSLGAPEVRTHTAARGEPGPFGVHRLPVAEADRQLVGPFREGDRYVVVEATERQNQYVAFDDAREEVLAAMQAEPRAVAHQLLLDTGFDPAAITFNDAALRSALPEVLPARPPET